MAKTPVVSFANLICRFGDKLVLLDLAREVVLPAFTDQSLKRKYGETTYFFWGVGTVVIENGDRVDASPLIVVYGRFVMDTVLTRQQVYSPDKGLMTAVGSMSSAPSCFFALVLNSHKIMYLSETEHAPSLGRFRATLQHFLTIKYKAYIDALFKQLRDTTAAKTKRQLREEIPHPSVEVLPLASRASIEQFLEAFAKITRLEFRILETNQEFQMQETFEAIRKMKRSLHAKSTKLVHDDKDGLDRASTVDQIHEAAATGNEEVKLSGTALDGGHLRGDNHHFKLSAPLEGLPQTDVDRAVHLVNIYQNYLERGILSEDVGPGTDEKIRRLRDALPDA